MWKMRGQEKITQMQILFNLFLINAHTADDTEIKSLLIFLRFPGISVWSLSVDILPLSKDMKVGQL